MDFRGVPMKLIKEEVYTFGNTAPMKGVITIPVKTGNNSLPAILLINTGLIHRIGPNQLYVRIARELAAMGFLVLRFDMSGIGDSNFREDTLPFEKSAILDIMEAMTALNTSHGMKQFMLAGICSGAAAAFQTACHDQRVTGAILINTFGTIHDTYTQTDDPIRARALSRHYIRMIAFSSFSGKNFLKALKGEVDYRDISLKLYSTLKSKLIPGKSNKSSLSEDHSVIDRIQALLDRGVRLLHIYSEGDTGLDYIHVVLGNKLKEWVNSGKMQMEVVMGSDHIFTLLWSQDALLKIIQQWAMGIKNSR